MSTPNFTVSEADHNLILRIAERAIRSGLQGKDLDGWKRTKIDIVMDLSATHNSNPLKLAELFDADDVNFAHDLGGIAHHLDRKTGQLGGCFSPRYSA